MTDPYTFMRWISATAAAIALVGLLVRHRWWRHQPVPLPTFWLALIALAIVIGWAAVTGALAARPGGLYVAGVTVATGWLALATWWHRIRPILRWLRRRTAHPKEIHRDIDR